MALKHSAGGGGGDTGPYRHGPPNAGGGDGAARRPGGRVRAPDDQRDDDGVRGRVRAAVLHGNMPTSSAPPTMAPMIVCFQLFMHAFVKRIHQ